MLFEIRTRLATKHGLGSSRQAISQHLEVLEEAGLVRTRRDGRYKLHSIDTAPLGEIAVFDDTCGNLIAIVHQHADGNGAAT